jgi:hypothetical protein
METVGEPRVPRRNDHLPTLEDWIRGFRRRQLQEPPEATVRRATALSVQLPPRRPAGVVAWLAELVFDSSRSPALAGLRGAPTGERRLLYDLRSPGDDDAAQLDLRLRVERKGTVELFGQVLPPPVSGRILVRAAGRSRTAPLFPTGEFLIRKMPVRGATLAMEIVVPGRCSIVLDGVPIPGTRAADPER